MTEESQNLEGRTLLLGDFGRFKLTDLLGGGLTAQVYRGEKDGNPKQVFAFKIANASRDVTLLDRVKSENECLELLAQAEKSTNTYFFPRTVFYKPDYLTHEGRWVVLVMDLIEPTQFRRISEFIAEANTLEEKEIRALTVAQEYARMLEVIHTAGITAADRKLDDVRWDATQPEGKRLRVLDWNVVEKATFEGKKLDLFRFGLLWYQLLIGVLPAYHQDSSRKDIHLVARPTGEEKQLWDSLSFGTRYILNKAMHPNPELRFMQAGDLHDHVNKHLARLCTTPEALFHDALRLEKSDLVSAFAAIDLVWHRARELAGLEEAYTRISIAAKGKWERLKDEVRQFIEIGKYDEAMSLLRAVENEINQLNLTQPELALLLTRYRVMTEACQKAIYTYPDRELWQQIERDYYRASGQFQDLQEEDKKRSGTRRLTQVLAEMDTESHLENVVAILDQVTARETALGQALMPLRAEAHFHFALRHAREAKAHGEYRTAYDDYIQAEKWLAEIPYRAIVERLAEDPKKSREETHLLINEKLKPLEYLRDATQCLDTDLESAKRLVTEGLRIAPLHLDLQHLQRQIDLRERLKGSLENRSSLDAQLFCLRALLAEFPDDVYAQRTKSILFAKAEALAAIPQKWRRLLEQTTLTPAQLAQAEAQILKGDWRADKVTQESQMPSLEMGVMPENAKWLAQENPVVSAELEYAKWEELLNDIRARRAKQIALRQQYDRLQGDNMKDWQAREKIVNTAKKEKVELFDEPEQSLDQLLIQINQRFVDLERERNQTEAERIRITQLRDQIRHELDTITTQIDQAIKDESLVQLAVVGEQLKRTAKRSHDLPQMDELHGKVKEAFIKIAHWRQEQFGTLYAKAESGIDKQLFPEAREWLLQAQKIIDDIALEHTDGLTPARQDELQKRLDKIHDRLVRVVQTTETDVRQFFDYAERLLAPHYAQIPVGDYQSAQTYLLKGLDQLTHLDDSESKRNLLEQYERLWRCIPAEKLVYPKQQVEQVAKSLVHDSKRYWYSGEKHQAFECLDKALTLDPNVFVDDSDLYIQWHTRIRLRQEMATLFAQAQSSYTEYHWDEAINKLGQAVTLRERLCNEYGEPGSDLEAWHAQLKAWEEEREGLKMEWAEHELAWREYIAQPKMLTAARNVLKTLRQKTAQPKFASWNNAVAEMEQEQKHCEAFVEKSQALVTKISNLMQTQPIALGLANPLLAEILALYSAESSIGPAYWADLYDAVKKLKLAVWTVGKLPNDQVVTGIKLLFLYKQLEQITRAHN
jgi:hypothetical protein